MRSPQRKLSIPLKRLGNRQLVRGSNLTRLIFWAASNVRPLNAEHLPVPLSPEAEIRSGIESLAVEPRGRRRKIHAVIETTERETEYLAHFEVRTWSKEDWKRGASVRRSRLPQPSMQYAGNGTFAPVDKCKKPSFLSDIA